MPMMTCKPTPWAWPARRAGIALVLCLFVAGGPGAAQTPPAQPSGAADAWQRQQPTRDRTQELLQQEGIRPSPAERREELRSLNEIHRGLMPPGAVPPAPGLAPSSGTGEAPRETGRD